jgi:hypothetical protein
VYPKVSGLVAWSENCKWYSSLPLDAVVSLFVSQFCRHNPLCCFSTNVCCCKRIFRYESVRKFLDTPSYNQSFSLCDIYLIENDLYNIIHQLEPGWPNQYSD